MPVLGEKKFEGDGIISRLNVTYGCESADISAESGMDRRGIVTGFLALYQFALGK